MRKNTDVLEIGYLSFKLEAVSAMFIVWLTFFIGRQCNPNKVWCTQEKDGRVSTIFKFRNVTRVTSSLEEHFNAPPSSSSFSGCHNKFLSLICLKSKTTVFTQSVYIFS